MCLCVCLPHVTVCHNRSVCGVFDSVPQQQRAVVAGVAVADIASMRVLVSGCRCFGQRGHCHVSNL